VVRMLKWDRLYIVFDQVGMRLLDFTVVIELDLEQVIDRNVQVERISSRM